jgi:hypothetical protein
MELAPRYSHQRPALLEMVLKEAFSFFLYDAVLLTLLPVVINLGCRWRNICKELLEYVILCYYFENKYGLVISTCVPHFTSFSWCCTISQAAGGRSGTEAGVSLALPAVRFSCLLWGQFPRWHHSRKRLSVCSILRYPDL